MSVSKFSLHIETRNELGLNKIYMSQRSKPDVLVISNVGGQTLRLNMFHVNEFWLYGYNFQHSLRRDKWLLLLRYVCTGWGTVWLEC
jgi:hypothetical protein